jgi:hypothetical protein
MSLNDISLNPFIAASLYRSSLIESDSNEPIVKVPSAAAKKKEAEPVTEKAEPATEKAWKYLGDNKKNILLVVNHSGITHLPDDELGFVTAILSACKLDMGDVAIVNRNNYPEHGYKEFLKYFGSKTVLLFGISPADFDLPVDFPEFQVQSVNNTTFLYSPPLEERNNDKLFKSKLWVCLQKMFLK